MSSLVPWPDSVRSPRRLKPDANHSPPKHHCNFWLVTSPLSFNFFSRPFSNIRRCDRWRIVTTPAEMRTNLSHQSSDFTLRHAQAAECKYSECCFCRQSQTGRVVSMPAGGQIVICGFGNRCQALFRQSQWYHYQYELIQVLRCKTEGIPSVKLIGCKLWMRTHFCCVNMLAFFSQ